MIGTWQDMADGLDKTDTKLKGHGSIRKVKLRMEAMGINSNVSGQEMIDSHVSLEMKLALADYL